MTDDKYAVEKERCWLNGSGEEKGREGDTSVAECRNWNLDLS